MCWQGRAKVRRTTFDRRTANTEVRQRCRYCIALAGCTVISAQATSWFAEIRSRSQTLSTPRRCDEGQARSQIPVLSVAFNFSRAILPLTPRPKGTAAFRAIEVDVRMFVFTSQDSDSESEPEAPRESTEEQWEKLDQTLPDLESRSPKILAIRRRRRKFELVEWFHNPLHDMESVFWITLYFLVAYDVFYQPGAASAASCSTRTVDESDSQRARRLGYYADLTNKVFQGGRASQTRYTMVWAPGTLPAYFRAQPLHPAITPLAGVPVVMLYALIDAYTKAEKDRKNIDRTCAQGVYEVFSAYLAKAQGHLASLECTVLVRPVAEEVRKLREQAMLDAQAAASRKRGNAKRGREGKGQGQDNHEADMEQPRKRQRRVGGPAGDDVPASLRRSARLRKEPAEVDPLNEPNVKVLPSRRRKLPVQHHAPAAAEPGRVLRSGKRRA